MRVCLLQLTLWWLLTPVRGRGLRKLQDDPTRPIYSVPIPKYSNDPLMDNLNIPANAADVGMWSNLFPLPLTAIHATVLPDGRVVMYGARPGADAQDGRVFAFWDPKRGIGGNSFKQVPNAQDVDSFCSSGLLMSDGKYYVSGGSAAAGRSLESSIIDWRGGDIITRAEDVNYPRWYGTMTKLPDGRFLFGGGGEPYANGLDGEGGISSTPEIYTEGRGWDLLPGAYSIDAFGGEAQRWWYPRQWVAPSGNVFGISTDKIWELDVTGNGSVRTIGDFKSRPNDQTRPNVGPTSTAVMYDTGKVIQVGGNGYSNSWRSESSAAATIFDINNLDDVKVSETQSMNFPRQWANSIVLFDGKVLVSGGSRYADTAGNNAVFPVEIWDPATERWTVGASQAFYRGYHSTAALLPNGAVFVGGGGIPGPVLGLNAQIYYPPYLFERQLGSSLLASRPEIISISTLSFDYGSRSQLQLAPSDSISEVSLVSLPTVTHSFDSNQRRMKLTFQEIANGIEITAPENANIAPPGYYYLSLLSADGVPSRAIIVSIDSAAPPAPSAEAPPERLVFGSSTYQLGSPGLTWEQAREEAESLGGKIVEIDSAGEQDFIFQNFRAAGPVWLGYTDKDSEGTFVNSAGNVLEGYSNFIPGNPDNSGGGQNYVIMASDDGLWDDMNNVGGWARIDGVWRGGQINQLVIEFSASEEFKFGSSTYQLGSPGLTWEQAREEAEWLGGKIVEIDSAGEQDFIFQNFRAAGPVWLGYTDKDSEGTFVNSAGNVLEGYSNFIPGNPDNWGGGQNYVIMASDDGLWDDMNNVGGWARIDGVWRGGQINQLVIEFSASEEFTFGSSTYQLGSPGLTWEQAREEAESLGGKIVEIDSAGEQDFIFQNFRAAGPVWLGYTDKDSEGTFVNSAGNVLEGYSNFIPGNPDNWGGGQNYVIMASDDGLWDDMNNVGGWARIDGVWRGGQINQLVIEFSASEEFTFGSSTYQLGSPGLTWEQAREEAESLGGKIVEIDSAGEQDFIFQNFRAAGPVWLGYTDKDSEGTFVNSAGNVLEGYSNFIPGNPDNWGGGQNYVIMASNDGLWDDMNNVGGWARIDGVWRGGQINQLVIEFQ